MKTWRTSLQFYSEINSFWKSLLNFQQPFQLILQRDSDYSKPGYSWMIKVVQHERHKQRRIILKVMQERFQISILISCERKGAAIYVIVIVQAFSYSLCLFRDACWCEWYSKHETRYSSCGLVEHITPHLLLSHEGSMSFNWLGVH